MAKNIERTALKRGKAQFNLIGKAKITDRTFNLENTYDSGWTDNSMSIGVDCGEGNKVYAEMRSGYFPDRDNVIRAFEKDRDENGKSRMVEIAWEDRLDEDLHDTIADSSFITVGVEKDVNGKTVYKKFLTEYDAVEYLSENLKNDSTVNVKGNISYSEYDGNVTVKKEIKSIVLSNVEDEKDFKATFTQTLLLDKDSISKKLDKEKNTYEISAYVVDYVGKPKIEGKKVEVKKNVVFPKTFEFDASKGEEVTDKILNSFFKAKKGKVTEVTVVGNLIEGGNTTTITEDDIPDDIKELIEMGLMTKDEVEKKAVTGGNYDRRMVITKPDVAYIGKDDNKKLTILFEKDKYEETDLYFYEQAILEATDGEVSIASSEDNSSDEETTEEDELMAILGNIE